MNIIPISSNSKTEESIKFEGPLFSRDNDLFHVNGELKVRGMYLPFSEVVQTCETQLTELKISSKQLHRAQLFHGSSSASLIAFTSYNKGRGALVPTGMLEQEGRVPFTGEIIFGRAGVNQKHLSTVWIGGFQLALQYANSGSKKLWSPEIAKETIKKNIASLEVDIKEAMSIEEIDQDLRNQFQRDFDQAKKTMNFSSFHETCNQIVDKCREISNSDYAGLFMIMALSSIEINAKRISEWGKLNEYEQELISNPFPIVYGIRSDRKEVHFEATGSDCPHEILLLDGALHQEIKVIFTSPEKLDLVRQLLDQYGHSEIEVEPLLALSNKSTDKASETK